MDICIREREAKCLVSSDLSRAHPKYGSVVGLLENYYPFSGSGCLGKL